MPHHKYLLPWTRVVSTTKKIIFGRYFSCCHEQIDGSSPRKKSRKNGVLFIRFRTATRHTYGIFTATSKCVSWTAVRWAMLLIIVSVCFGFVFSYTTQLLLIAFLQGMPPQTPSLLLWTWTWAVYHRNPLWKVFHVSWTSNFVLILISYRNFRCIVR